MARLKQRMLSFSAQLQIALSQFQQSGLKASSELVHSDGSRRFPASLKRF